MVSEKVYPFSRSAVMAHVILPASPRTSEKSLNPVRARVGRWGTDGRPGGRAATPRPSELRSTSVPDHRMDTGQSIPRARWRRRWCRRRRRPTQNVPRRVHYFTRFFFFSAPPPAGVSPARSPLEPSLRWFVRSRQRRIILLYIPAIFLCNNII